MIDERARLAELHSLNVLPVVGASPALQAIVSAAAAVCDVPIALVTLLDDTHQHFKAQIGLEGVSSTDRQVSFCTRAIEQDEILEVVDALEDDRFRSNPLVLGDPWIRFYAGAPMRTEGGHRLGTVCVIDHRPRSLNAMQRTVLASLAQATVAFFEDEREVLRERAWSQRVLDSIADCVISTDADGRVDYVNPAAAQVLDLHPSEALHQPIEQVLRLTRFGEPVPNPVLAAISAGETVSIPDETRLVRQGRSDVEIEDSAAPIRNELDEVVGAVMAFRDVTAERETRRQLEWYGTRDPLTGVLNRFSFETAVAERLDQVKALGDLGRGGALLYGDLDRFKGVNDELGHAVGDQLLRQVATAMASVVEGKGLFARIGGDEFGVLLPPMETDEVERLAAELLQALVRLRHSFIDSRVNVGASFGMVMLDEAGLTLAEALRRADISCYAAKNAGGDQSRWYDQSADDIEEWTDSLRWMNTIEQAIHRNELSLFGQHITPIYPATLSSVEVLVRHEASGEIICPATFMPTVERFLLGRRLDEWVLANTLSMLKDYAGVLDGIDAVHINLCAQTIGDRAMIEPFMAQILASGITPSKLCFEITESGAVAHIESALAFIAALQGIGCRFALDDFGCGFASLEYLKRLPVDIVKIDGMFIVDLTTDEVSRHMVVAIQGVCDLLGVQTIAECVEDPALLPTLSSLGVHSTQGFYEHRPEPLGLALAALRR